MKEVHMRMRCLVALTLVLAGPAAAAKDPKPLFAADDVLRITFKGPVGSASLKETAGSLIIGNETLPMSFSERGITRRASDVCQFAPLRVTFTRPPPPTSLFVKQKKLKLVTHCRSNPDFQQYVLLEYAAYKMFNRLTPASFRTRLAIIDYVSDSGKPITTRYGFFIEDTDDMAKRLDMKEPKTPDRVPITTLSPAYAARVAMFHHMLGNHDWSMRAGPAGAGCCHNGKLIGPIAGSNLLVPVPYDFDFSGFVGAPYATPPDQLQIKNVRERLYRGYCSHNPQALQAAGEMRAAKSDLLGTLAATPGIEPKTVSRATAYLEKFFADIATEQLTTAKVLKTCL
jgi:hypothetical protein